MTNKAAQNTAAANQAAPATVQQRYTSAGTSINSSRRPRIYSIAADRIETGSVIDYGCGRFFDNYDLGDRFTGYDPYNRPDAAALDREYDIALCSNVLNVVMEADARRAILETLKTLAPVVLITVYEGDRSRQGRATKADCYQLNRPAADYIPEIVSVFGYGPGHVTWNRKGYFECCR